MNLKLQLDNKKKERSSLKPFCCFFSSTPAAAVVAPVAAKPVVVADKPHLPVKPSQIRDDGELCKDLNNCMGNENGQYVHKKL
jgi:hypothetical protein